MSAKMITTEELDSIPHDVRQELMRTALATAASGQPGNKTATYNYWDLTKDYIEARNRNKIEQEQANGQASINNHYYGSVGVAVNSRGAVTLNDDVQVHQGSQFHVPSPPFPLPY
mmetsp:Transcript_14632/g.29705  ORF Transcript_14632/g.29705 Transcript_14632/m.29705 type:complete len:115 (+) Transcript_14632:385-729(+)